MTVFKDLGIKGRVLLLTLLPTSLLALVLGGYFTAMQLADLHTQLLQRGQMLTEHLAPLSAPALLRQNTALLQRIATDILDQPDVRAVTFRNAQGKPLAHAGPTMGRRHTIHDVQMVTQSGDESTHFSLPAHHSHPSL